MPLRLHDTALGQKVDFEPLQPGLVRIYTCGPTVWNFAHVGNFRTFLFYDLLRRHLLFSGYRVDQSEYNYYFRQGFQRGQPE